MPYATETGGTSHRLRCSREQIEGSSAWYRELLLETLRDNNSAQGALESKFVGISNVQEWSDTEVLRAVQCLVVLGFITMNRVNTD